MASPFYLSRLNYDCDTFARIIVIMLWSILVYEVGTMAGEYNYQKEAVSKGLAHWEVKVDGKTTFMWNTNKIENVKEQVDYVEKRLRSSN